MTEKYPALTSPRFFAAWTVVAYHAAGQGLLPDQWLAWSLPSQAVSVFFVLSGFVLQRASGGELRRAAVPAFLVRRIARIWPLHSLVAIILVVTTPSRALTGSIARVLTLTHAWSADQAIFFWQPNTPSWSLSVEFFFYLCFPLLTGPVRRHKAGAAMAALLWLVAYIALRRPADQTARFGDFFVYPLGRLPEFLLDMCAAESFSTTARIRLPRWGWTLLEGMALAGVVGLNVGSAAALPWIARHFGLTRPNGHARLGAPRRRPW